MHSHICPVQLYVALYFQSDPTPVIIGLYDLHMTLFYFKMSISRVMITPHKSIDGCTNIQKEDTSMGAGWG